jgi:hypothetical protein
LNEKQSPAGPTPYKNTPSFGTVNLPKTYPKHRSGVLSMINQNGISNQLPNEIKSALVGDKLIVWLTRSLIVSRHEALDHDQLK